MEGFQRDPTVPFGQDIDPESEQHAGSLWAQWVPHTCTPEQINTEVCTEENPKIPDVQSGALEVLLMLSAKPESEPDRVETVITCWVWTHQVLLQLPGGKKLIGLKPARKKRDDSSTVDKEKRK